MRSRRPGRGRYREEELHRCWQGGKPTSKSQPKCNTSVASPVRWRGPSYSGGSKSIDMGTVWPVACMRLFTVNDSSQTTKTLGRPIGECFILGRGSLDVTPAILVTWISRWRHNCSGSASARAHTASSSGIHSYPSGGLWKSLSPNRDSTCQAAASKFVPSSGCSRSSEIAEDGRSSSRKPLRGYWPLPVCCGSASVFHCAYACPSGLLPLALSNAWHSDGSFVNTAGYVLEVLEGSSGSLSSDIWKGPASPRVERTSTA